MLVVNDFFVLHQNRSHAKDTHILFPPGFRGHIPRYYFPISNINARIASLKVG